MMKVMKVVIMLVFLFSLVASYGSQGDSQSGDQSSGQEIIITDQAEREITISGEVKTIASSFMPATLNIIASGLWSRVTGAGSAALNNPFVSVLDNAHTSDFTDLGSRSSGINFEAIVDLNPDLFVLFSQRGGVQDADTLTELGVPTYVAIPETLPQVREFMNILGVLTNTSDHTNRVSELMDEAVAWVADKLKDLPEEEKLRVFYASSRGVFNTITGEMFQDTMITLAGAINVSHDEEGFYKEITPEQLVLWNPDVIFMADRITDQDAQAYGRGGLENMSASVSGRLFRFPSDILWDWPSPFSMAGVVWMAANMYPGYIDKAEALEWIEGFYDELLGEGFVDANQQVLNRAAW